MALTAILPLVAGPARAQGGPHGPHGPAAPPAPPPPGGRQPGGSGPSFTPGLTLSFTIKPKAKAVGTRERPIDDHALDTVVFILRDPGGDSQGLAQLAGLTVAEAVLLASVGLVMVVGKLAPGDTPAAAIGRLNQLPGVAWAQANHLYQGLAPPARASRGYELQGLTRETMASPASGVIAMIDTAVALDHEALAGAAIQQRLFAGQTTPGVHGTAVAGLIVGRGGGPGTAQGARLVSLAAFQQHEADGAAVSQTRYLAKALDGATRLRPNVLNLSFGGPGDRLLEALLGALDAKGVCMVAAAGNGGRSGRIPFPASHPAVLGVTAVDDRLRIYALATPGPQVDVAAVGVDVTAAVPGGYRRVSGSSFATAAVSGALLRTPACGQARDPAAMRAAVAAAARDLGAPGRDDVFGDGLFRLPAYASR